MIAKDSGKLPPLANVVPPINAARGILSAPVDEYMQCAAVNSKFLAITVAPQVCVAVVPPYNLQNKEEKFRRATARDGEARDQVDC
jgi:hypothetical protein